MNDFLTSGFCHRCGGELAPHAVTDESGLFCPHCGAPQILLPDYLRPEPVVAEESAEIAAATTGAMPPPVPQAIDWRAALACAGIVAAIAAALTAVGVVSSVASLMNFVWVTSGGVVAVSLYQKQRAAARMSARVGARIGIVTALLMVTAMGIALATAGVVARFGLKRMDGFDTQVTEATQTMQAQMTASMQEQKQSKEIQDKVIGLLNSPEVKAGVAVVYLGILGGILVLFGAGGGAFAGMLGARRQGVQGLL